MIAGSEVKFHVEECTKGSHEVGVKFCSAVGSDVGRNSVFREDVEEEVSCDVFGGNVVGSQNENSLFRKSVNDNENGGICVGIGELFDEIHGD